MKQFDALSAPSSQSHPTRRRPPFLLLLFLVVLVLIPFLFWRGTWFGRRLSEEQTLQYLSDSARPRKTQHALVQVSERIVQGDPTVKRWYPQVIALASHDQPQIRSTVAWVMGQDNHSEEFHAALPVLLRDSDPLVRRNAALSLVRFGDATGRAELARMLRPYAVTTPHSGVLEIRLEEENPVNPGTLLGKVQTRAEEPIDIRSPLPGTVDRWLVSAGEAVRVGEAVVFLSPTEEQVWEALRALYLVGQPQDLTQIEPFAEGIPGMAERVQRQAILTSGAIRRRAEERKELQQEKGPG